MGDCAGPCPAGLVGQDAGCGALLSAGPPGSCAVLEGLGRKPHSAYQPLKSPCPQVHRCLVTLRLLEPVEGVSSQQNRVPQTSQLPGVQADGRLKRGPLKPSGSPAPRTRVTLMIVGPNARANGGKKPQENQGICPAWWHFSLRGRAVTLVLLLCLTEESSPRAGGKAGVLGAAGEAGPQVSPSVQPQGLLGANTDEQPKGSHEYKVRDMGTSG